VRSPAVIREEFSTHFDFNAPRQFTKASALSFAQAFIPKYADVVNTSLKPIELAILARFVPIGPPSSAGTIFIFYILNVLSHHGSQCCLVAVFVGFSKVNQNAQFVAGPSSQIYGATS
jgi:hypothetical protein